MDTTRFAGRRVLITGATAGIGLAGARRIADEGGSLVPTGRNPQRLDALRAEFPDALVLTDDAADPETGARLAAAVDGLGGLDGLWLNAGYADIGTVDALTAEFFDAMTAANVRGPALQLAALSPHLRTGAAVLATSSTAVYEGAGVATVYAATKGAVVAMVRGWAEALAPRGIRANTLIPGPIDTDFRSFMSDDVRAGFESGVLSQVPLGRVGTADEAAAVAAFLLSPESGYVTGAQYAVDGGLTRV